MTFGRLLWRNLFYHWRGNFAVFLGVALGTAVLTGALCVGDSLRGSLRSWSLRQLGWVDQALIGGRFIREELADEMARDGVAERISPILMLQGAVTIPGAGEREVGRAGKVMIYGVDDRFWRPAAPPVDAALWKSSQRQAAVSAALATELKLAPGQTISLHLPRAGALPREFMLSHQDASDTVDTVDLVVARTLEGDDFGNRFNLQPSPQQPRNVFVPLRVLQAALTQAGGDAAPRLGLDHPVNVLAAGGVTGSLEDALAAHITLDDYGLVMRDAKSRARVFYESLSRGHRGPIHAAEWPRLRDPAFAKEIDRNGDGSVDEREMIAYFLRHHDYLTLESRQLFLPDSVADAAREAATRSRLRVAPTLVYLADTVADGSKEMPYAVIAAVDPALAAPLGPFLPELPRAAKHLQDDEIVLADWSESPFQPGKTGGSLVLKYYDPEVQELLRESPPLKLAGWVKLQGAADDPDLTPTFPGITDKASLAEWAPPKSMHFNSKRVTRVDEDYWKDYRTTPRAYVTLATGQRLWGSRFGKLTSVRLAPVDAKPLEAAAGTSFVTHLMNQLRPGENGFVFQPLRARALEASSGATDFGGLFLGFSIFLIAAALLLVGLLFRLNLERRASEIGLLLATGISRSFVRRLLLFEGVVIAAFGGVLGVALAIGYAWVLLVFLRTWWPGGLDQSFLQLHVASTSLAIGYVISLVVSVLTIAWSARALGRVAPRALLAGETADPGLAERRPPRRWVSWLAGGLAILGIACIAGGNAAGDPETRASSFFGGGMLLLIGGIMAVWLSLRRSARGTGRRIVTVGVRNAGRHPARSLLTVGLLASAAFVVIAVQSFRQDPGRDFLSEKSGSGGFTLVGESDVPLFVDPQSARGQADLRNAMDNAGIDNGAAMLADTRLVPFRLRSGEDASCLNLYQAQRPRILGAPAELIERGGFQFQDTEARTPEQRANPWLLLEHSTDDAIPVFGEANTVEWMLKSGLGKTLEVPDETGRPTKLRIAGLLQDSVFQSELVMSGTSFQHLYPHEEGYRFFLIATPAAEAQPVGTMLAKALSDHGFTVTSTRARVAAALAVENTYLATFQALGGLGLLLGAFGLAIVLLRSVWERRGELALLQAVGFRRGAVAWLVLAENGFLLVLGLIVGAAAAILAVAPEVAAGTGKVPLLRLIGFLAVVLAVGLAAGAAAVMMTLRAPLLAALRRE